MRRKTMRWKTMRRKTMRRKTMRGLVGLVIGAACALGGSAASAQDRDALFGDLNGNGVHDFDDVEILRAVIDGARTDLSFEELDINRDRVLDATDAEMLQNWAERSVPPPPPDEGEVPAPPPEEPEPKRPVLRGDLDGDDDIDLRDVALLEAILSGRDTGKAPAAADVDGDGRISVGDLVAIVEIFYGRREPSFV